MVNKSPSKGSLPEDGPTFKAGPSCGGKLLAPQEDFTTKEIQIPTAMQKTLIFVVDLSEAQLMDPDPKSLEEMTEDIVDAMGVASKSREFQVILAGYDCLERLEITNDEALRQFFNKLELVDMDKDANDTKNLYGEDPTASPSDNAKKKAIEDRRKNKEQATTEFLGTKEELSKLKLGNIITKLQMGKFIKRLIEIQSESLRALFERDHTKHQVAEQQREIQGLKIELEQADELYKDLEASIETKIAEALAEAKIVWDEEKREELEAQKAELNEKFKAEKKALQDAADERMKQATATLQEKITEQKDEIRELREESKNLTSELNITKGELAAAQDMATKLESAMKALENELGDAKAEIENMRRKAEGELKASEAKAAQEQAAMKAKMEAEKEKQRREKEKADREAAAAKAAEDERRAAEAAELARQQEMELAKLKEEMAGIAKQLEVAYQILDDYCIPIPGRTTQGHDARSFRWKLQKFEEKVADYAKDRAVTSPEFTLFGLKGLQIEWFPNGLENSFPGWSAIKLRLPGMQSRCRVQIKWRVIFGNNLWVGPRSDEFCEEYWWCKKGLIAWPNFCKTELLRQQMDEKGCVVMTLDIIKATITPVDDKGVALSLQPKRLPQVLSTSSAATLHSIALGGGANSITAKHEKGDGIGDHEIVLYILGELYDDPSLKNLIRRYIKQTHIPISNNPYGVGSANAASPNREASPCTLRPRGAPATLPGSPNSKGTRAMSAFVQMRSPNSQKSPPNDSLAGFTTSANCMSPNMASTYSGGFRVDNSNSPQGKFGKVPPLSPQRGAHPKLSPLPSKQGQ